MPEAMTRHHVVQTHGNDLSYSIKTCRGKGSCSFGLVESSRVKKLIEQALNEAGWDMHMKERYPKGIPPLHRLRIAMAACPNGCSQPQIHDIGLIAAMRPYDVTQACTGCGRCEKRCRETAIFVQDGHAVIGVEACLACGECARSCPVNAIRCKPLGFRLLLGGHMGRHPAWATELHGLFPLEKIPYIIFCLACLLIREALEGERPSQTFVRLGFEHLGHHLGVKNDE